MSELDALIRDVRLLAEAALMRRLNAGSGFADPRIASQIYLRDPQAAKRLAGGQLRPKETHAKAAGEIAEAISTRKRAQTPRVDLLCERLAIDPASRRLLELAIAYALDLDTREICHTLVPRRSAALYVEACADIYGSGSAAATASRAVPATEAAPTTATTTDATAAVPAATTAATATMATAMATTPPEAAAMALAATTTAPASAPIVAAAMARAVMHGSPLRRGRVINVDGDGLDAKVELAAPVLAWLLGDDALHAGLANIAQLIAPTDDLGVTLPPGATASLDALLPRLRATTTGATTTGATTTATTTGATSTGATFTGATSVGVVVRGPRGSGRKAAAHRLAKALGRPLLVIPVPAMLALETRAKAPVLGPALAAARLRDAVPYFADADALFDDAGNLAPEHADALAHFPGVVLAGSARSSHLELKRPVLGVALPRAELDDRERAWTAALGSVSNAGNDAAELAGRYVIGPGAIAEVVGEAKRYADAAGTQVDIATLEAAVGRRLALRLGTYGTVVQRKSRFAELVLPEDVIDTLHDMIAMVRERSQILERWGYQRHLGISRGVSGLYSGEPGTGKTMAASVVASELGLELVRIDLSAVVSKYVGETEKNLAKIFDEAQDAHAMLLFDEADSLFGKRTKLETAQDRFANLEVNYILQRMETFDGVSVLTTNAEAAIDPALQRRLNFRIRFPEPEVEERVRLWQQLLPPSSGLHDRVDFHGLAERFDMTGGYIKNAVVRAAVIAARAGRAMVAEDLWLGAHHEYVEMGKVMPQPGGSL